MGQGFYAPTTGGLPTLQGQEQAQPQGQGGGYWHTRPLPAPYGGGGGDIGRVPPPQQIPPTPSQPPVGQPPAPTTPPITPPYGTPQTSAQGQGNTDPSAGYTGGIYHPKPPTWRTDAAAYRPIQFPGVKHSGGGRSEYEDGSIVDYGSNAWQKAATFQPPSQYGDLWAALPDSWKVDLAGRDPTFVAKYLDAVQNGNNTQAQQIYKDSGTYRDQQNAAAKQAAHPQRAPTEYRKAAFYVPTR